MPGYGEGHAPARTSKESSAAHRIVSLFALWTLLRQGLAASSTSLEAGGWRAVRNTGKACASRCDSRTSLLRGTRADHERMWYCTVLSGELMSGPITITVVAPRR